MRLLEYKLLDNALNLWFMACFLAIFIFFVLYFTKKILFRKKLLLIKRKDLTNTALSYFYISIEKTYSLFLFIVAIYIGSHLLELPKSVEHFFLKMVIMGLLVETLLWSNAYINLYKQKYIEKKSLEDLSAVTAINLIAFFGKTFIFTIIILLALDQLGVNITTLVAGLGIGGIAVALAVQNILGDLFASLTIILDRPFVVGDLLEVGAFIGTVEKVGLKTTRLRNISGEQVVFANADLLQSRIRNYQMMFERRVVFTVSVSFDTSKEKLEKLPTMIKDIIAQIHDTRLERVHFLKIALTSLDFEIVYYVLDKEYIVYMQAQEKINLALVALFEKEGIRFAHPVQISYLRQDH